MRTSMGNIFTALAWEAEAALDNEKIHFRLEECISMRPSFRGNGRRLLDALTEDNTQYREPDDDRPQDDREAPLVFAAVPSRDQVLAPK